MKRHIAAAVAVARDAASAVRVLMDSVDLAVLRRALPNGHAMAAGRTPASEIIAKFPKPKFERYTSRKPITMEELLARDDLDWFKALRSLGRAEHAVNSWAVRTLGDPKILVGAAA